MLGTLTRKPFRDRNKNPNNQTKIMGDKSPKANQKKSEQKKAKAGQANQVKKQAEAAKQVPGKK